MAYFTKDFISFFKELEKNNNKEWFDANRKRYEASVKKPFYTFLDEMIGRINALDPEVRIQAKDAVMRINRDIRFSPDKTPYNAHYGGIISSAGRKDKTVPGIFLRFTATKIGILGGAHGIDKDQLRKVRTTIAKDLKGFKQLINGKAFKEKFGEILGDKHKRIPKEFQSAFEKEPLIANKAFYYMAEIPAKNITDDRLPDIIMDHWTVARPVMDFLTKAMK